ncbi:MAG TPA: DNA ligase D [Chitinophagaceae bacterium]
MNDIAMGLTEYREKRKPGKTPEPSGGKARGNKLHFVVQQHQASHLHYDFRLELKGVLKSWAVPKGPSLDPAVRRSAFMVEDHPYDYKDFEGNIPKGNYGAGAVIIWDEGSYEPVAPKKTKKENENWLLNHLHRGSLEFVLHGKKLKGRFRLTHLPERGENNWLLVKVKDSHARKKDILEQDRSVVSGLTVVEMAGNDKAATWQSNRPSHPDQKVADRQFPVDKLLRKGKKASMPSKLLPMSATLAARPLNDPEYIYELKFDGYRIIAYCDGGKVLLHSKAFLNFTRQFEAVSVALASLELQAVLDGEVIAVDKEGKPDFQVLGRKKPGLPLRYYVFDILWLNGYDLRQLPLEQRKQILRAVVPFNDTIRYSDEFDDGEQLFEGVKKMGLEGIVAKKRDSTYVHRRSKEWLKVKTVAEADLVLGGWTESESGKKFRSLLFGYYEDGELKYFGHVGHGFNRKNTASIVAELERLATKRKPFSGEVETSTPAHWLRPERVIRVQFDDVTGSGRIRKPARFVGFRNDMNPEEVTNPVTEMNTLEAGRQNASAEKKPVKSKTRTRQLNEDSNWPQLDAIKIERSDVLDIQGNEVTITNIDKVYWEGITKGDLIHYYIRVAPFLLPHLMHRPLSLHIKPNRPAAPGLYIKDMEERQPAFAEIHRTPRKHRRQGKRDVIDYLVCNNLATLVYAVNLGCIDFNPWTSRAEDEQHPDFIIIDLDPSDDDFKKAVTTAQAAKEFFDENKLKAFVKTSGKTGIHLYLPCRDINFRQARGIAENICAGIHELVPSITTTNVSVSSRGNRLFIDPSQNDYADTVAAAYSARPHGKPTVSAPIEWRELNERLSPDNFTILNMEARLKKKGDLFAGVMDPKIAARNSKVLLRMQ